MASETNGTMAHGMSNGTVTPGPSPAAGEVLDVKSEAFRAVNERRGDLIFKKYQDDGSDGLTAEEQAEYERLDRIVGAAIERAFPAPTHIDAELAAIKASLRANACEAQASVLAE